MPDATSWLLAASKRAHDHATRLALATTPEDRKRLREQAASDIAEAAKAAAMAAYHLALDVIREERT